MQIGIHRSRQAGPYLESERQQLGCLIPHLAQAARIMHLLTGYESALRQSHAALDRLPMAIWLLDGDCHCRWLNAAAEQILRGKHFGLTLRNDSLYVKETVDGSRLSAVVRAIRNGNKPCATLRLAHPGSALVVMAEPESADSLGSGGGHDVLVFLVNPDQPLHPDPALLQELYGLTPAEIRLIHALLQGLDLREASTRFEISPHTARSQLKSAMHKTGSRRQADLIRTVMPVLRRPDQELAHVD